MKRLGYLNEPNIHEFYDSYADLIKVTGGELNAKQYLFAGLRYGYISLAKNIAFADKWVRKEISIMGMDHNSKLPLWIQAVYKHKVN